MPSHRSDEDSLQYVLCIQLRTEKSKENQGLGELRRCSHGVGSGFGGSDAVGVMKEIKSLVDLPGILTPAKTFE
jgi:hypothetical protein